jgi:hypothetical protein
MAELRMAESFNVGIIERGSSGVETAVTASQSIFTSLVKSFPSAISTETVLLKPMTNMSS